MDKIQIRSAVENAIADRNIIDDIQGRPALSPSELNRIVRTALVDGISAQELGAARSLFNTASKAYELTPNRANRERLESYSAVYHAFDDRVDPVTRAGSYIFSTID